MWYGVCTYCKGMKASNFIFLVSLLPPVFYSFICSGQVLGMGNYQGGQFQAIPRGAQEEMMQLSEKVRRGEVASSKAWELQKKIAEKYKVNMGGLDSSIDPVFLEGLDMRGIDSSMTPVGFIPYTQETSNKWNGIISQRHNKKASFANLITQSPPMIFRVKRWTKPLSAKALGGANPHPFMTALDENTILTPSVAKVFSNPSSYLLPNWNSNMIFSVFLVPASLEGEPAFKIPYVYKHKTSEGDAYSFYIPEGLGEFEIIRIMQYLQRKAQGEEVEEFSLYEQLMGLPENISRKTNGVLSGLEKDSGCSDIATPDEATVDTTTDKDKAELWDKALTEITPLSDEEWGDAKKRKEFTRKMLAQKVAWDELGKSDSDDIVNRLNSIINSSASPQMRWNAFSTLIDILEKRGDTEGVLNLLTRGISDPSLSHMVYAKLNEVWGGSENDASQRLKIENIIASQLGNPDVFSRPQAISFFLDNGETHLQHQLEAVSALDSYLGQSPPDDQPSRFAQRGQRGGNMINWNSYNPAAALLRDLVSRVQGRLRLGFNDEGPTADDLYFVNQSLPVIMNHLDRIDDGAFLAKLIKSHYISDVYKVKFKERMKQLIAEKKAELDQELEGVGQ